MPDADGTDYGCRQHWLGKLQHGSIHNLFIVSERECAAVCVLAHEKKCLRVSTLAPCQRRLCLILMSTGW
jgi:hypothetical protein